MGPVEDAALDATVHGAARTGVEPGTVRTHTAGARRRSADTDAGQRFVARLRAAAPGFARAAGAQSAMVPEAVPPARHRRCRCRVVLQLAGGEQVDVTFLGPAAGSRGHLPAAFDEQIQEWLRAGRPRDHTWLVVDPDAVGGVAVDLTAWSARQ